MTIRDTDLVIGDDNFEKYCINVEIDGEEKKTGLIPRDYEAYPVGCYAKGYGFGMRAVRDVELIPMEEWPDRIRELVATKSQLSDFRMRGNNQGGPIPSLDQNGKGYCWSHSATSAAIISRCVAGMPYVRLSAYAIACIIKNYADQGGWGAAALDFITNGYTRAGRKYLGVPSIEFWPEKSMSRNNDNERTWNNAALHVVSEGFIDLEAAVYDRNLSAQQVASCLLQRLPVISDYNWWGHSVCGLDLVDVYPSRSARDISRYGVRILNSWSDGWGTLGMGVLKDRQAWPDGATAIRAMMVSNA